jgi:hypothetical protein
MAFLSDGHFSNPVHTVNCVQTRKVPGNAYEDDGDDDGESAAVAGINEAGKDGAAASNTATKPNPKPKPNPKQKGTTKVVGADGGGAGADADAGTDAGGGGGGADESDADRRARERAERKAAQAAKRAAKKAGPSLSEMMREAKERKLLAESHPKDEVTVEELFSTLNDVTKTGLDSLASKANINQAAVRKVQSNVTDRITGALGAVGESARCAFPDRKLHSSVSLDPTHVRLKQASV